MAPLLLTVLLTLATGTSAATQVTWASVAFVNHGEKIPFLNQGSNNLTPLGANQLLSAGSDFRDRYVSPPVNASQLTVKTPINGLNVNDIENTQLYVASQNDEWVSASAMAFMQGLYPPRSSGTLTLDGESIMGNGSLIQYPLDGYQYPNIETLGSLDFNSVWIGGNSGCNNYARNVINTMRTPNYVYKMQTYEEFYANLTNEVFFELDPSVLNYGNAYELYEYAAYQYEHNKTIYNSLHTEDLAKLRNLASLQQWAFNTPDNGHSVDGIAGQTLAGKMLSLLAQNIASGGVSNKLAIMFGSFEPMLSFFALSGLSSGPSSFSFQSLPEPGSVMILELFSYSRDGENAAQNLSTPFPNTSDLWVRFLFRNGTSDDEGITAYPLFGRGLSETDMPWNDFAKGIADFAITDVADWCTVCDAVTLFCQAIESNISNNGTTISYPYVASRNYNRLAPAVAGVIGAAVTLALFIIVALALVFFGFRIDRREKQNPAAKRGDLGVLKRSGSGGFKGAEKLASDTDLTLKGGAGATIIRHERVGSWELNNSPTSPTTHSSLDKEIESSRTDYERRSEDGIGNENPFGDPVKPKDHI